YGFFLLVQSISNEAGDVSRHRGIYLLGERDKLRIEAMLPSLPREVMGVERNAVAADSGAREKRHEAEGLRRGGADNFPSVDAERIAKTRHFVCHADIYRAKGVFPQLARFSHARRGNRMDLVYDLSIKHRRCIGRIFRNAADHLWNIVRLKLRVAGIDALGRKSEQKIAVELKAAFFEHRLQNFVSRSGISGRFENYELSGPFVFLFLFAGRKDKGHIGILCFSERRRDANDNHIALAQTAKIGRGGQFAVLDTFLNVLRRYIGNIRTAGI